MKRFAANYVFPVNSKPIKNGIIETTDDGEVIRIIDLGNEFAEIHSTQFFNGVIVPGFVNAHSHLELSYLKGLELEKQGIVGFIDAVTKHRFDFTEKEILDSIEAAIQQALNTGTIAIADICNTTNTLTVKQNTKLIFYNFIENFGISPIKASVLFNDYLAVKNVFSNAFPNNVSLTPHSPYSISKKLWMLIADYLRNNSNRTASIHYGESHAEYEFLRYGTGPLRERYQNAGIPFDEFRNLSPSDVVIEHIPDDYSLLLIHCTFATAQEISLLNKHYRQLTVVTCPESNLRIENKLPNLLEFAKIGINLAIGTDSLASATSLNMLSQINIILDHFQLLNFDEVLKWGTLNGAKALNLSHTIGSIEPGKKPGLVLISAFDFERMRPTVHSKVKRLI